MKVRAEGCYGGGQFFYRVTVPVDRGLRHEGTRFRVAGDTWGRPQAREALDMLGRVGARRRNVRFAVE